MVSRAILREAPVACDLRFLLSVVRVAPEFERFSVIDLGTRHTHLLARPRSQPLR